MLDSLGDIFEHAEGGEGRVVGVVDHDNVGQLAGGRALEQLLLEVGEGNGSALDGNVGMAIGVAFELVLHCNAVGALGVVVPPGERRCGAAGSGGGRGCDAAGRRRGCCCATAWRRGRASTGGQQGRAAAENQALEEFASSQGVVRHYHLLCCY